MLRDVQPGPERLDPAVTHWPPLFSDGGRLTDEVLEWITQEIIHGGLLPGEWISEAKVAEALNVSRSPVHQALQVLAAIRVVDVVPRRGTRIADPTQREVDELYRTRALIDGELTSEAVRNGQHAFAEEFTRLLDKLKDSIGDDRRYFDGLERIWAHIRNAAMNRVLAELSALLGRRSIPIRGMLLRAPRGHETNYEFMVAFAEAVAARDPEAARARVAAVIDDSRKYALEHFFLPTRHPLGVSPRLTR